MENTVELLEYFKLKVKTCQANNGGKQKTLDQIAELCYCDCVPEKKKKRSVKSGKLET